MLLTSDACLYTLIPDPKYLRYEPLRGWRRVVHFLTRWPFFARNPIAVWDAKRIFTHPKNMDAVRAWLEARGVPYRVNALAPVRDLTAEPRT